MVVNMSFESQVSLNRPCPALALLRKNEKVYKLSIKKEELCSNFDYAYFYNEVIKSSAAAFHSHCLNVSSSAVASMITKSGLGVPTPCSHIALCSLQATYE